MSGQLKYAMLLKLNVWHVLLLPSMFHTLICNIKGTVFVFTGSGENAYFAETLLPNWPGRSILKARSQNTSRASPMAVTHYHSLPYLCDSFYKGFFCNVPQPITQRMEKKKKDKKEGKE